MAEFPNVRLRLLQTVKLLPHQRTTVSVQLEGDRCLDSQALLLEPEQDSVLHLPDSLINVQKDQQVQVQVFNPNGLSCHVEVGV